MEPYYVKDDEHELGVYIGDDNIIYVRMQGNLTSDNEETLTKWDTKVREAMRTVGEQHPGNVLCLTDTTGGQQADAFSLELLKKQFAHNKAYVTRTAVFGMQEFPRLFVDMALRFTHRSNMKMFEGRDKAMKWLLTATLTDEAAAK